MTKLKKRKYAPKTSKHFANEPTYQRLVFLALNVESTQQVANKLGRSKSTIYRWLKYGVPDSAKSDKDLVKRLNRVTGGIKSYRNHTLPELQKEYRPIFYYRTHGGVRTKYWIVENASYEQMLEIVLLECMTSKYNAFYFLLKFEQPFTGYWDGENARFYQSDGQGNLFTDDGDQIPLRGNKAIRDANSFVTVTADQPFLNTRLIQLSQGDCHPDRFENNLFKYFHMKHFRIMEIRFNEIKLYNGKPINIYADDYNPNDYY